MRIVLFENIVFVLGRDVAAPKASLAKLIIGTSIGLVLEPPKVVSST